MSVFLLVILAFSTIYTYLLSHDTYKNEINVLNEKEYPLKKLICIGLYIQDKLNLKYTSKYSRRVYTKIGELTGHRNVIFYLRIHTANKVALLILVTLFELVVCQIVKVNLSIVLILIVSLFVIFTICDTEIEKKIIKRKLELQLDFPDFVNKLLLLVNSGMNVGRAWEKASQDGNPSRQLYFELNEVSVDIANGKSERQSYEDFAKRCRIPEITKFVSIIIQNLKKGNSELVPVLRLLSNECWQMRKTAAKTLGEEASTKLLLPMSLMFIAILIIVILPAVMAMQGAI